MKIHLARHEPKRVGGGWSWGRNFAKVFDLCPYDEADIYLIPGPTQVTQDEVNKAKQDGKKIVLRLDNMPRHSRNSRNAGVKNIKYFCEIADLVIYQSRWARDFLYPFTQTDGPVILNGVDTEHFNSKDRHAPEDSYLYARSSRDEGKNWISAWYWFVNNKGTLDIVGKFSSENLDYNFDFYNNEQFRFFSEQPDLAPFFRKNKYFLYTYICDACSNTLLEARASGCEIIDVFGALKTGGAPEIMELEDLSLERMAREYREAVSVLL